MKARNTLFAVLMLSLPAISAEHSEMKMTDMSTSASSQEYMAGMKDMHDKSKRAARTVLTGMCYSVGSATRQGSSSLTRFIGQSAMTLRT